MNTYKDLIAWRKSMRLAEEIYRLTDHFPSNERFSMVSQMRRSAVSIPSNLAEGYRRRNRLEWRQFVRVAFGSAAELETQLLLSKNVKLAQEGEFGASEELLSETLRLLNGLCRSLQ